MARTRKVGLVAALASLSLAADQTTKSLALDHLSNDPTPVAVTPFFKLALSFNPGVSFGMLREVIGDHQEVVATGTAVVALGLLVASALVRGPLERSGLSMMAGGAFGNAVDRWRRGAVTDFIDLHAGGYHWPAFNVADIAIVGGCALVLADGLFRPAPSASGVPRS